MTPQHDPPASLEQLGWRQCSIIEGRDLPDLARIVDDYTDDDIFIVLPYSCAVVQMNFDKEPNIELFRVRRTAGRDKGMQFGRNPRSLQLIMEENGAAIFVNGSIHDRFFIGHHLLVGLQPSRRFSLSDVHSTVVKNWFAKRYLRNAFPTEFNRRARTAQIELNTALKASSDVSDLLGVYIDLDPHDEELEDVDDVYEVKTVFLVKENALGNIQLNTIKTNFERALSECEGILVTPVETRSETDMLLSEYRSMVRLDDYDFISYRDNQDDPTII